MQLAQLHLVLVIFYFYAEKKCVYTWDRIADTGRCGIKYFLFLFIQKFYPDPAHFEMWLLIYIHIYVIHWQNKVEISQVNLTWQVWVDTVGKVGTA